MRKRYAGAIVLIFAAVLAGVAPASAAPRYVGLGDSFAAGPLIPLQIRPFGCLKSNNNYIHMVQRREALRRVPRPELLGRGDRGHDAAAGRLPAARTRRSSTRCLPTPSRSR